MINHLWLEETYAKWEVQSVSNPRYTHFPPRTNLSEVVGKTPIDQKVIRQFWDDDSDDEEEDSDEEMPDAGEDEPTAQFKGASSKDLQTPRHADSKEMATVPLTERRHTTNGLATPGGRTTTGESTVSTPASKASSRRAKEKATSRLSESIMDMNLYEKEKKRKGGVLGTGRKRKSSISELERSFSEPKTADESEGEQPKKKAKNRIKPTVKLLITGYSGWTTQAKEEKDKVSSRQFYDSVPSKVLMLHSGGYLILESNVSMIRLNVLTWLHQNSFVRQSSCVPSLGRQLLSAQSGLKTVLRRETCWIPNPMSSEILLVRHA